VSSGVSKIEVSVKTSGTIGQSVEGERRIGYWVDEGSRKGGTFQKLWANRNWGKGEDKSRELSKGEGKAREILLGTGNCPGKRGSKRF